VPFLCIHS